MDKKETADHLLKCLKYVKNVSKDVYLYPKTKSIRIQKIIHKVRW